VVGQAAAVGEKTRWSRESPAVPKELCLIMANKSRKMTVEKFLCDTSAMQSMYIMNSAVERLRGGTVGEGVLVVGWWWRGWREWRVVVG
jgi:hypothetical protein